MNEPQPNGSSSSATATIMDVLPLVFLLVMGIVISSTCSKYSSSSASSSHSSSSSSSSLLESQSQQKLVQELVIDSSAQHKWNSSPVIVDNDDSHQSDSSFSHSFPSTYTSFSYLRREMLSNTSVTCNDGTVAGYYIRPSFGSRRWIVFLEGGWYCISTITCHQRWLKMRSLMTSAHWPEAKTGMSCVFVC
jgi:hypothetical protein